MVEKCVATIDANKALLTELDQAIGDGDHGVNMVRGFAALRDAYAANLDQDFPTVCRTLGTALVMNVGGASGPLMGSFLMAFGRGLDSFPQSQSQLHAAFAEGVEAVKKRGKSDVGAKTMLDVLAPVADLLAGKEATAADIRNCATAALENTRDMIATKGRSAYLGPRSRGHLDPGAQSCCLLIEAVCDVLESSQ